MKVKTKSNIHDYIVDDFHRYHAGRGNDGMTVWRNNQRALRRMLPFHAAQYGFAYCRPTIASYTVTDYLGLAGKTWHPKMQSG